MRTSVFALALTVLGSMPVMAQMTAPGQPGRPQIIGGQFHPPNGFDVRIPVVPPTVGGAPTHFLIRAYDDSLRPIGDINVGLQLQFDTIAPAGLYVVTVVAVNVAGEGPASPMVSVCLGCQTVYGTPNTLAKWKTATLLGDSAVTEVNGNVSIGTPNPSSGSRLEVFGAAADAVRGVSDGGVGVVGEGAANGVYGRCPTSPNGLPQFCVGTAGVSNSASGDGVRGIYSGVAGQGVYGIANANTGLAHGVRGDTNVPNGWGVVASHVSSSGSGGGLLAMSANGLAAQFVGDVQVLGNISQGGGSFEIDHPLDPLNRTLSHSFVESPDMKNVYDGVVLLDERGEATVTLPEYFDALNADPRYQLTPIGGFAPLFVAQEVRQNQFKIAGGTPGLKVSWQVTGVRIDAWAEKHRIPIEGEKPPGLRGQYLHPDAYEREVTTPKR